MWDFFTQLGLGNLMSMTTAWCATLQRQTRHVMDWIHLLTSTDQRGWRISLHYKLLQLSLLTPWPSLSWSRRIFSCCRVAQLIFMTSLSQLFLFDLLRTCNIVTTCLANKGWELPCTTGATLHWAWRHDLHLHRAWRHFPSADMLPISLSLGLVVVVVASCSLLWRCVPRCINNHIHIKGK